MNGTDENSKKAAERRQQKEFLRVELQAKILARYPKLAEIKNNSGRGSGQNKATENKEEDPKENKGHFGAMASKIIEKKKSKVTFPDLELSEIPKINHADEEQIDSSSLKFKKPKAYPKQFAEDNMGQIGDQYNLGYKQQSINDSNIDPGFEWDEGPEPQTDRDFYNMNTERKLINMETVKNMDSGTQAKQSTMGGSTDRMNQMAFLDDNVDSDTSRIGKSSIYKKKRDISRSQAF